MKFTNTDKLIAYLALLSGLSISAVAIYYSVAGLVSIFSAAVIPIIVMGVVLEVSKLIATMWLKINWNRAPFFIKAYMSAAIVILMIITSMGIFGFLSKAHSDQSLVSGDVQSKIAIYDEKIKTARENIEANRKQLKQMDEAVDQIMGRSTDEKGADKANAVRRSQQRDRTALAKDIEANQKLIASLNDEAAPIRAEVRKVEAEVGPIKYIAAFIYGDNPDANLLEKAVTWVIIIIVAVFDPLAVILLLASQYSFQWFRKREDEAEGDSPVRIQETEQPTVTPAPYVQGDDGFRFLADYDEITPKYPASDADIDELLVAKNDARTTVRGDASIKDEPAFKEAVEAGIYNADGSLAAQNKVEVAPPGTPGEEWALAVELPAPGKSEQPTEDNLDKIYKASSEELAKKQRSRGWFQAVFPKKDNQ
jgi:Skp family chaperone for outer membrane proteins